MQIQSQSTREAIAVNPVPFSGSFEVQVEAIHLGRDGAAPKAARQIVRSPQLSLAEQLALTYRTRDDRLAVIAHELLNSLSVVRNASQTIRRAADSIWGDRECAPSHRTAGCPNEPAYRGSPRRFTGSRSGISCSADESICAFW
jgi:signal transduction histidine kinase